MSIAAVFVGKGIENAVFARPHFYGVPADRFFFLLGQWQRRLQKFFDFFLFAGSSFQLCPNREFAHGGSLHSIRCSAQAGRRTQPSIIPSGASPNRSKKTSSPP